MLSIQYSLLYFSFFAQLHVAIACVVGGSDIGHTQVLASPAKDPPKSVNWKKIALTNVKVFDGTSILPPSTVIIDGPRIGLNGNFTVDETIDGQGGVLLPGLIDSHAHPANITHLEELVSYGVTTVMNMGCGPEPACNTLRGQTGVADFYTAGWSATSPNSTHANLGLIPPDQLVSSPSGASLFVSNRVGNGSDYIKLIAESDGMTQQEHDALVSTSHASGMQVMTHTQGFGSYQQAIASGTDIIQHITADSPLTIDMARVMLGHDQLATPTLTIIGYFVDVIHFPGWNYTIAEDSVQTLYKAGVTILAGTDANIKPFPIPFGISLHGELERLVQAGMSTVDVLRAVTKRPAHAFGLWDRGVIKPGYRADLVLIDGDPIANISNTRNIQKVWASGLEYGNVS